MMSSHVQEPQILSVIAGPAVTTNCPWPKIWNAADFHNFLRVFQFGQWYTGQALSCP